MKKNLHNSLFLLFILLLLQSCGGLNEDVGPSRSNKYSGPRLNGKMGINYMSSTTENQVNPSFTATLDENTSTFSIDVDVASYSNIRSHLNNGMLPNPEMVRVEEMINYFNYDYAQPKNDHPYALNNEIQVCPWNKDNKLVLLNLKAKDIPEENIPASNLVFLIDVSGSMGKADKLPLLKSSIKLIVDKMRSKDKIAIVVYAGAAGLVLPSTSGAQKSKILASLDKLSAGGSTAGGKGLHLAYKVAQENMIKGANNRVILATDGDFNVGPSSDDDMIKLIEEKRETGIYMTALGFGRGFNDAMLEKIADHGNGNYAFIDNINEANKVMVKEFGGTIFTLANDVKIQVVFDADVVMAYRLIGYKNRRLDNQDFVDDKKDAGELGSGHTVTALYELIMQKEASKDKAALLYKTRYKLPNTSNSIQFEKEVFQSKSNPSQNFMWATAVAEFGLILSKEAESEGASFDHVLEQARKSVGSDLNGYRKEFLDLVHKAKNLQ